MRACMRSRSSRVPPTITPPESTRRRRRLHRAISPRFSPDHVARPSDAGYSFTTRSTHDLIFLALFFVFFRFVVLAQHLTVSIHLHANFLAVLVDNGFKVGAFLLPADYCSTFCLSLSSLLHRGRDIRTADGLFFVFFFLRLSSHAKCQSGAYRCYCE